MDDDIDETALRNTLFAKLCGERFEELADSSEQLTSIFTTLTIVESSILFYGYVYI